MHGRAASRPAGGDARRAGISPNLVLRRRTLVRTNLPIEYVAFRFTFRFVREVINPGFQNAK
jgi:hypothetical protein